MQNAENVLDRVDSHLTAEQAALISSSNEALCLRSQGGDMKAREELIDRNQKLVTKYAAQYARACKSSLELEDLKQAGYIGLMRAAERFDLTRGCRFSTYAVYWIRQAILREIMDSGSLVRLPVHVQELLGRIGALGADETGFDERVKAISAKTGISEERVADALILKSRCTSVSLDAPIGDDEGGASIGDLIENSTEPSVEETVTRRMMCKSVREVLSNLSPRAAYVIGRRYGMDGNAPATLDEVGSVLGVTRERVRQIQNEAERRLRVLLAGSAA